MTLCFADYQFPKEYSPGFFGGYLLAHPSVFTRPPRFEGGCRKLVVAGFMPFADRGGDRVFGMSPDCLGR